VPLDYNSLLLAIGFAGACLAFTLFATWLSSRSEGFLLTWAAGALFLVGNVFVYSAYVSAPALHLAVLAFFLLISGFAVVYGAAVQFRLGVNPLRRILITAAPALVIGLGGFATRYDVIGFILTNLVAAGLLFASAREYWLARDEARVPILGLTFLYALAGVSFLLCAAVLIADGELVLGKAPDNWAEDLTLVVSIAALAGIGALSLALNQWRLARTHHREARTDALTGLLNRRAIFDLYAERSLGAFTSVVVFDLDGFKAVNDGHGHAIGDEVLRRFASAIGDSVRSGDVAARLGGEEFALVLPHANMESALQVAERIRGAFADEAIETGNVVVRCTVSAGVAMAGERGQPFEEVLRNADAALYAAKRNGRNRVVAEPLRLVG
jgi:diguanylate cyclase (GGDEF)-like protein